MDFGGGIFSSIIGAGANLASAHMARQSQKDINRDQMNLAQQQMNFQKMMSDTAYQRAVKDLKAAGLSPMLAYSQGGAEGAPGAMAQLENPDVHMARGVSDAVDAAIRGIQTAAQVRMANAQARKTGAEASLLEGLVPYSADMAFNKAARLKMDVDRLMADTKRIDQHTLESVSRRKLNENELEKLRPLVERWHQLRNQAEDLGMAEREALNKLYDVFPESKWLLLFKQLIK